MVEPRTEVDRRLDLVEQEITQVKKAVGMMAQWLVQSQTGLTAQDAEKVEKILRGERLW